MNNLLTPEDSKRVADAIIHMLRKPSEYSHDSLGESISKSVKAGVETAIKDALFTGFSHNNLGNKIVETIYAALKNDRV
jgi:hypothetical protein